MEQKFRLKTESEKCQEMFGLSAEVVDKALQTGNTKESRSNHDDGASNHPSGSDCHSSGSETRISSGQQPQMANDNHLSGTANHFCGSETGAKPKGVKNKQNNKTSESVSPSEMEKLLLNSIGGYLSGDNPNMFYVLAKGKEENKGHSARLFDFFALSATPEVRNLVYLMLKVEKGGVEDTKAYLDTTDSSSFNINGCVSCESCLLSESQIGPKLPLKTPLAAAVEANNRPMVKLLLQHGASLEDMVFSNAKVQKNLSMQFIYNYLNHFGSDGVLKDILLFETGSMGQQLQLFLAIQAGDWDMANDTLQQQPGLDVNFKIMATCPSLQHCVGLRSYIEYIEMSPLAIVCQNQNGALIKLLMDHGASTYEVVTHWTIMTCMRVAFPTCEFWHSIVHSLVKLDSRELLGYMVQNMTDPIPMAIFVEAHNDMTTLIDDLTKIFGLDVVHKAMLDGSTPYSLAVKTGELAAMDILKKFMHYTAPGQEELSGDPVKAYTQEELEGGKIRITLATRPEEIFDIKAKDPFDIRTLLHYVNADELKVILNHNPEWIEMRHYDESTLWVSLGNQKRPDMEKVRVLKALGAQVTAVDREGNTMLHLAVGQANLAFLLSVLVDEDIQCLTKVANVKAKTPLHLLAEKLRLSTYSPVTKTLWEEMIKVSDLEVLLRETSKGDTLCDIIIKQKQEFRSDMIVLDKHDERVMWMDILANVLLGKLKDLVLADPTPVSALASAFSCLSVDSCKMFLALLGGNQDLWSQTNEVGMTPLMALSDSDVGLTTIQLLLEQDPVRKSIEAKVEVSLEAQAKLQHMLGYKRSVNKPRTTVIVDGVPVPFKQVQQKNPVTGLYEDIKCSIKGQAKFASKDKILAKDEDHVRFSRVMVTGRMKPTQDAKKLEKEPNVVEDKLEHTDDQDDVMDYLDLDDESLAAVTVEDESDDDKDDNKDIHVTYQDVNKRIALFIQDIAAHKQVDPNTDEDQADLYGHLPKLAMEHYDASLHTKSKGGQTFRTKKNHYRFLPSATTHILDENVDTLPITSNYRLGTNAILLAARRGRWDLVQALAESADLFYKKHPESHKATAAVQQQQTADLEVKQTADLKPKQTADTDQKQTADLELKQTARKPKNKHAAANKELTADLLHYRDPGGENVLMMACKANQVEVVDTLLPMMDSFRVKIELDMSNKEEQNKTVLKMAEDLGHHEIVANIKAYLGIGQKKCSNQIKEKKHVPIVKLVNLSDKILQVDGYNFQLNKTTPDNIRIWTCVQCTVFVKTNYLGELVQSQHHPKMHRH